MKPSPLLDGYWAADEPERDDVAAGERLVRSREQRQRAQRRRRGQGSELLVLVGVLGLVPYLLAFVWAMEHGSYEVWAALLIAPVLVLVSVPILSRAARREPDSRIGAVLGVALVAKLLGALLRYHFVFDVYGGTADAGVYYNHGVRIGEEIRNGIFALDPQFEFIGTGFIRIVTGFAVAIAGPSRLAGFLLFSWLAFWGLFCFWRAFCTALPDGDRFRYALLVLLLPSLLFWPSSIGKESWMVFSLGLGAYGAARILAQVRGGYTALGLGLLASAMVRPHLTLMLFFAAFAAFGLRRSSRVSTLGPVFKVAGIVVFVLAAGVVMVRVESFFGVDDLSSESIERVLDRTEQQSVRGGSEYTPVRVGPSRLWNYPLAVGTVLFRPLPTEAHNSQATVASLEALLLLALLVASRRRLGALPRMFFTTPYVTFVVIFVAMFCYAFAAVGNFGILARQRTQMLPFLLVLLALPAAVKTVAPSRRSDRREPRRASS